MRFIVLILLGILIPATTFAQTSTSTIQAQIATQNAQIASLQSDIDITRSSSAR